MDEVWKLAPGFETLYEVSSYGRVRSFDRKVNRWQGMVTMKGRLLKCGSSHGYRRMTVQSNPNKHVLVHRLVATAFIPNPRGLPYVNHKDGNRANNHVENLEWCTHRENMRHAFATGLTPIQIIGKGDACPAAKLTEEQVKAIKTSLRIGARNCDLAAQYRITSSAIAEIKAGRSWGHVS